MKIFRDVIQVSWPIRDSSGFSVESKSKVENCPNCR